MRDTSTDIIIDGELWSAAAPDPDTLPHPDSVEADPDAGSVPVSDLRADPEGWRYYADVLDAKTIAWILAYAARHPEDDYIQERAMNIRITNEEYRERNGYDLPGYDEELLAATNAN